jgi:hypothetical protein
VKEWNDQARRWPVTSGKRIDAKSTAAIVALALAATSMLVPRAFSGTPVYKCVKDGQVTLTDKPCEGATTTEPGAPAAAPIHVPSSKNPSPVGTWSGQIQYQENQNGQTVAAAHSVALLKAEFTADGKVSGASDGNGCQLLGVWSDGGQTLVWIDITLSGCSYAELNRRYHGSFILARPDSSGQLAAESLGIPVVFSKDVGRMFDIKGTLRR